MTPEVRAGAEFRIRGRTLTGTVLRYGDVALVPDPKSGRAVREVFRAGAFAPMPPVPLVVQHDESLVIAKAGEYRLHDSPEAITLSAELRAESAALALVRQGRLSAFSIKFWPRRERIEDGVRVISSARLGHVGLVDVGAYPDSVAEVRARGARGGRLGTIRGSVPTGRTLDCECGPDGCVEAVFETGSLDSTLGKDEVLATVGDFSRAFAAKSNKGVRFWRSDRGLEFAVDVPKSEVGELLMEQMRTVPVFARPSINLAESTFERVGTVARYSQANIRGMIVKPTDRAAGWSPVVLGRAGEDAPERAPGRRRSASLWL